MNKEKNMEELEIHKEIINYLEGIGFEIEKMWMKRISSFGDYDLLSENIEKIRELGYKIEEIYTSDNSFLLKKTRRNKR